MRCSLFLVLTLLTTSLIAEDGYHVIPDQNPLQIETPSLAERKTLKIQLDNGLQALLISDPNTDESAAALAVNAGSWSNPKDGLGMAHFLEHLLFLGTAKYPDEGSYMRYLSEHGGQRNAFTAGDRTVFIFSVRNDGFVGALDRFAQFFIAPLFTPSAVGREMIAIDQENAKNLQDDIWRFYYVRKAISNPENPANAFETGNRETLAKISSDTLKAWYASHYSANLMHLVVYSNLPMGDLVKEVAAAFSPIVNRQLTPFQSNMPLFNKAMDGHLITILPYQEMRELILQWELPIELRDQARFLSTLLRSGQEGSLLSLLQEEGLAESCSADVELVKPSIVFTVALSLTQKGVEEKEQVLARIFQEISLLQQGIPHWLYEEQESLTTLQYAYQSRSQLFNKAMQDGDQMVDEPLATYPYRTLIPTWDPSKLARLAKALTPESCQFFLIANQPIPAGVTPKKEPWLGATYFVTSIDKKQLESWRKNPVPAALYLPKPNPFIPGELSLLHESKDPVYTIPIPQKIIDSETITLYYAPDFYFQVPKALFQMQIYSQGMENSGAREAALLELYVAALAQKMTGITTDAAVAGLHWTLQPIDMGLSLQVGSYSEKAHLLLDEIGKQLHTPLSSQNQFQILKDRLLLAYQNASSDTPLAQGFELFKDLFLDHFVPAKERYLALKDLTEEEFFHFVDDLFRVTTLEGLCYGNIPESQAIAMAEGLREHLHSTPWDKLLVPNPRVLQLNKEGPIFQVSKKVEQLGQLALLVLQPSCFNFRDEAAFSVLTEALKEPFFSELRTKEQTGYITTNLARTFQNQMMELFLVQSSTHASCDLIARFELFLENFLRSYHEQELTKERFESIRTALLEKLEKPANNLGQMMDLLTQMAFEEEGDFDWWKKRTEAMQSLTYEEISAFTDAFLGRENKRRLSILICGSLESNELVYTPTSSTEEVWLWGHFQDAKENLCSQKKPPKQLDDR